MGGRTGWTGQVESGRAGAGSRTRYDHWALSAAIKIHPAERVPFAPEQVTPGKANPVPLSGALMVPGDVKLSWHPAAGSTQYSVQVSQDPAFATLQIDQSVSVPSLKVDSLSSGTYFWRVQAIDADGAKAEFSPVNMITLKVPKATRWQH